ncbi:hypothetical protein [Thermococcus sp. MAR1]|uniref:hypothetical protein n=1 Tax=Thermococcus sp. MAR1 TaxID=1638263 RepID=UPI001438E0F9|nr:hypothetical protein [Thermococcus sp. MAR1]NJE10760.1 hypothetical protein [Thermococcus sp. MAR1]
MGAADVLATLGAVFFIILILTPFLPTGMSFLGTLLLAFPLVIMVLLLVKVYEIEDRLAELKKALEELKNLEAREDGE